MYQKGDEVYLKKPAWFPDYDSQTESGTWVCFMEEMLDFVGTKAKVTEKLCGMTDCYRVTNNGYYWHKNWLEPVNQVNVDEDTLAELLEV